MKHDTVRRPPPPAEHPANEAVEHAKALYAAARHVELSARGESVKEAAREVALRALDMLAEARAAALAPRP